MKDNSKRHFLVHVFKDKDCLTHLYSMGCFKTKKEAKKSLMDQASNDLTSGRYHFYRLIEQKNIVHETYPSTETTE